MNRPRPYPLPIVVGVAVATLALGACSTGTPESPGQTAAKRAGPVAAGVEPVAEGGPPIGPARVPIAAAAVRELAAADAAVVAPVRERGHAPIVPMPSPIDPHGPVARADAERYASIDPNPVRRTADEPVSTFSIDVDTGSYANVRRLLGQGTFPPAGAVRVEELVNYFGYDYPVPDDPDVPFSVTTTLAPTPWADTELLRIGIRGLEPEGGTGPANLVFLVGTGNYDDELMERLADAGNGNHAYVDTLSEARKVLAEQLAGTLFTIAGDVKIQLELNPAVVSQYRLLGYENRVLAEADFIDDAVDAGEIGAGHQVTALYEIARVGTPGWMPERRYGAVADEGVDGADRSGELGELRLRWKLPGQSRSAAMAVTIGADATLDSLASADDDFRFAAAVAAWGELLRDGRLRGATIGDTAGAGAGDDGRTGGGGDGSTFGYADIRALARGARGEDAFGYRSAFLELVGLAEVLDVRHRAP